MSTPTASIQVVIDWLTPAGRITGRTYFLQYFLPASLLAILAAMMANQEVVILSVGLLAVGTKKRLNDTNFNISRGKKIGFTGLGVFAIRIAAVVTFAASRIAPDGRTAENCRAGCVDLLMRNAEFIY